MNEQEYYIRAWQKGYETANPILQGVTKDPYKTLCNMPEIVLRKQPWPDIRNANCIEMSVKVVGNNVVGTLTCQSFIPVCFHIIPIMEI